MAVDDPQGVELEHRIAKIQASTFVVPKTCEEGPCPKRATQAIAFYSDDPAFPLRIKFVCKGHLQKIIDGLASQHGATIEGSN